MSDHHFWVVVRDLSGEVNASAVEYAVQHEAGYLGPGDVSVAEMDTLRSAVWQWIISSNDGAGVDVEDLMSVLDRLGFPCPDDMAGED